MRSIGEKIRKLRFEARKTQADVAGILGVSIPAFSKMECGITDVNASRIIQIATVFGVHPSWFFLSESEENTRCSNLKMIETELLNSQKTVADLQERLIHSLEEKDRLMKIFVKLQ